MVLSNVLQSTAQCSCRNQEQIVSLKLLYWDQYLLISSPVTYSLGLTAPSESSSRWHQGEECCCYGGRKVWHSERPWQDEVGLCEPQQDQVQGPGHGWGKSLALRWRRWGYYWLRGWTCAPAAQKAKCVLACIKRSMDSGGREVIPNSAPLFLNPIWNTASTSPAQGPVGNSPE